MEQAGKALWRALRRVARPEKPLDLLSAVWPVMVGPRLAAHTRPISWHKGEVGIEAADSEWYEQLASLREQVRAQINRWWGTELVQEVRVTLARRPRSASKTPKHREILAPAVPLSSEHAETRLQEALKEVEPALRGIADSELRDLIARVASRYLEKKGKK